MANVRSDIFNAFYTTPRTLKGPQGDVLSRGALYASRSVVVKGAGDANGTIYPMFRCNATWRLLWIFLANDLNAALTDVDFGIYTAVDWSAVDGVAQASAAATGDQYFDGLSMAVARNEMMQTNAAVVALSEGDMMNVWGQGTNGLNAAQWGRRIWEDITGLTTEPRSGTEFDLCLRANVSGGTGSNIVMGIIYATGA